jgi:hypothetical protein
MSSKVSSNQKQLSRTHGLTPFSAKLAQRSSLPAKMFLPSLPSISALI